MKANISEIFYSIQGEGQTIGFPAIFVRFCGCNLNCPFCDTKYALNCENWMEYKEIIREVKQYPSKRVIFTGGEPALQGDFIAYFMRNNPEYTYQIETNGTILLKDIERFNHITISPKMFALKKEVLREINKRANSSEFKFVVTENFYNELRLIKDLNLKNVVFQPIWENETMLDYLKKVGKIIEKIKIEAPFVRVIPQFHKIIYGSGRGI